MYPRLGLDHPTPTTVTTSIATLRGLSPLERQRVLDTLNEPRFQDLAPREVYGTLLSEGQYLCHWRTMYRILQHHEQVHERRQQRRHPVYHKPQLLAISPNQVWTWDITRLLSTTKWRYFYLYVMLDIFSRFVTGWMLAEEETAELATHFIQTTCARHAIRPDQLTIHADRGAPMTAKTTAQLLVDLGVTQSHSRPRVSNDNPYSEAAFKTAKYAPTFPGTFQSRFDAEAWAQPFFDWYNFHHCHSGIALLTPAQVHFGQTLSVLAVRQSALDAAYALHPQRFVRRPPLAAQPPAAVGINWPTQEVIDFVNRN